jgi:hypothetical protein
LPAQAYLPLAKENPGRKARADPPGKRPTSGSCGFSEVSFSYVRIGQLSARIAKWSLADDIYDFPIASSFLFSASAPRAAWRM